MKKITKLTAIFLILSMLLAVPTFAEGDNHLKEIKPSDEAAFFNLVFSDVVAMYQFDVGSEEIFERMVTNMLNEDPEMLDVFFRALFDSFDDYSEFYTADEYKEMMNNVEAVTGGIGVYIEKGTKYVRVTGTVPDGPAAKSGVSSGDDIISINGENVEGRSLDYVSSRLRGEIGTSVLVTVLRDGETYEYALVREELSSQSTSYGVLSPGVGYLGIHGFATATASEVEAALKYFDDHGIKKIVIDLRDNGGGYVNSAIEIARMFVPAGNIISHYIKANDMTVDYKSYLKKTKYQLVTLVNENTASASEILASALQDSGASKLVGQKTFGKAVTQSVFPLYSGRYCKLTTGEYFTRNGEAINKVGLTPDVRAENKVLRIKDTNMEALSYCSSYEPGVTQEGISGFKKRLQYLDYDVGTIDNVYNDAFKNAVYAYQSANGIKPTGVLDLITQIHITNTTDDIKVLIDVQLKKAVELLGASYSGLTEK